MNLLNYPGITLMNLLSTSRKSCDDLTRIELDSSERNGFQAFTVFDTPLHLYVKPHPGATSDIKIVLYPI